GYRQTTPEEIVQIDSTGTVFGLGLPAGLPAGAYDAGDVSPDGATMFLNAGGADFLYEVDLATLIVTSTAITGDIGVVGDWAFNPVDGLLYGGDSADTELATLDPATGIRTDLAVTGLPPSPGFGGAWFTGAGELFLYSNDGNILQIDLSGPPTIVLTQAGPASTNYDAAACVQGVVGAAKNMAGTSTGLPATMTIDYVFENLSLTTDMVNLLAADDLVAVFG
ncbi:MAG: hypothetical protein GY713_22125, partial [Actinomycetia bacterium]|nr:hypothetical protein [Actinomycetes bacterium]